MSLKWLSLTQLINNDGVSLAGVPTLLQPSHILHWDPVEHRQHTRQLMLTFVLQHKNISGLYGRPDPTNLIIICRSLFIYLDIIFIQGLHTLQREREYKRSI